MNYELVKKLKRARFPESIKDNSIVDKKTGITYYFPCLSELIEACGKEFHSLVRKNSIWSAIAETKDKYKVWECDTPEEAVAKLWLELNNR